ncbi:MAG: hypothetical protein GY715_17300 [Planctomycetes bacterium]|nr:hypothetical protein [Planctomycetota bacterium]
MIAPGLLIGVLLALPPLTADQRTRLDTAVDGRGHEEEAFVALLENARERGRRDAPPLPAPDAGSLVADPDAHRGAAFRVIGVIQQQRRLPRPFDEVHEWFVRDDEGTPLVVFVTGAEVDPASFADGRRIVVDTRFYKRLDAVGRDGTPRSYAGFVGADPRLDTTRTTPGASALVILVVALPTLVIVLIVARAMARRSGPGSGRRTGRAVDREDTDLDESPPLPEDPGAALAELKRRAERS